MKKTLTFILILVLFAVGAAFVPDLLQADLAFAETTPTITATDVTVHRGQMFSVDVNIANNVGFSTLRILVSFDTSVMTFKSATLGSALSNLVYTPSGPNISDDEIRETGIPFTWTSALGNKLGDGNGLVITLQFESSAQAEEGDYTVRLSYDQGNAFDADGKPVAINTVNGTVSLKKGAFRVNYYDDDGTLLFDRDYNDEDKMPNLSDVPAPSRPTDDKYEYQFVGWVPMVSDEPNVLKLQASYNYVAVPYMVMFYVDGELFDTAECKYGTDLTFPSTVKQGYVFSGWFLDEKFTQRLTSPKMAPNADHVWNLYGYYKYNVREENVPEITLSVVDRTDNLVTVDAEFSVNMGVAAMSMDLDYDRENLTFKGFKLGSVFANSVFVYLPNDGITLGEDGFYRGADSVLAAQPFRFTFNNGLTNVTDLGLILRLQFEVSADAPNGVYTVSFSYDKSKDAYFFDKDGNAVLTMLDVVAAQILQGVKTEWSESVEGDSSVTVGVSSSVGMEMHTELVVTNVSDSISGDDVASVVGSSREVKGAYALALMQDNVVVQPNGVLQVRIRLASEVLGSELTLYAVGDNGNLVECEAEVVDGELVFSTETLGTFVIVGNKTQTPPGGDDNPPVGGDNVGESDGFIIYIVLLLIIIILILLITTIVVARDKESNKKKR